MTRHGIASNQGWVGTEKSSMESGLEPTAGKYHGRPPVCDHHSSTTTAIVT
ncbi:hypothetical protein TNCV_1959661 [Trichonephila clavipes]|nr:hypothetical protein TNCV_1959661 [Trichonephila clavipes]